MNGPMTEEQPEAGTVDPEEVARFSRVAGQWWDPRGPMAALHKFNPVRLAYIRDRAAAHFDRDPLRLDCLAGLRVLDIGCGGGILCEPLTQARRIGRWRRPIGEQHCGRAAARGKVGPRHRLSQLHGGGAGASGRSL